MRDNCQGRSHLLVEVLLLHDEGQAVQEGAEARRFAQPLDASLP